MQGYGYLMNSGAGPFSASHSWAGSKGDRYSSYYHIYGLGGGAGYPFSSSEGEGYTNVVWGRVWNGKVVLPNFTYSY